MSNKRSRDKEVGETSNKRQTTLTSMFKPVTAVPKSTTGGVAHIESLQVASKDPRSLFKGVNEETLSLLELELNTMNYEWLKALAPELVKPSFLKLKNFLKAERDAKKTIFPPLEQIYSWSNYTPASKVEVVILGQDPYHDNNQAHGLCFSVVKGVRTPPSLVNMYKALKIDYPDFVTPNHGYLENWAKQGVLMLNTSLSVEAHKAGSHAKQGWEELTDAIIKYINERKSNVVFMLWGAHAQKKGSTINQKKHLVLKSVQ
ncbi:uracil-DNA glycosylase-like protein [Mucor mucedo]|uniref:uracil-DNA glycosylase-like protein n=1 Tax=Mucor mucedo TaxID=29922 RepID=UPI00221F245D|nr:uracil-DNA glycosylase-like protein [Mucor mucedo]KAI7888388.1 uracil-DNA glycosylase-like protein [Mucor mucedo]